VVKVRLWIRSENHEDRREEFGLNGERDRLFEYGRIILIKSKDESPADRDSKSMERLNDISVLRWIILKFFGGHQVFLRKRFETDEKAGAPTLGQRFHIFDLFEARNGGLAEPFLLKRD
jgi:hypothetical protein